MKLKILSSRLFIIVGCLIFSISIVSCGSHSCEIVPCHLASKVDIEPPAGTGGINVLSTNFNFQLNDEIDTYFENGVDMQLDFSAGFAPVGFIQIVRTINLCDGRPLYPSLEKSNRAVNGWYVDRHERAKWAVYGQRDDGVMAAYASSGIDGKKIFLQDSPYRPENHPFLGIRWQAVSVPADLRAPQVCDPKELGYYYWTWTVAEDGSLIDIDDGIANRSLLEDVKGAIYEWRVQHKAQQQKEQVEDVCIATSPVSHLTNEMGN